MKNVEKVLHNSTQGIGPKISPNKICAYAEELGDEFVDILFKVINEKIEDYYSEEKMESISQLVEYIDIIINNNYDIDRRRLSRKILKLEESIDRVLDEKSKKFSNKTKAHKELGKIKQQLLILEENCKSKESKQYFFIESLVNEIKDLSYIEETFRRFPSLVNVKDKTGKTIYEIVINKFMEELDNDESSYYYVNLLTLIQTQKEFKITELEKKKILDEIYKRKDHLSYRKKLAKQNKDKIIKLETLKDIVLNHQDTAENIEQLTAKYNIPFNFEQKLIEEVNMHQTPISKVTYPDRFFVDDYIITIDDNKTVEIDDALSCKKLENGNYLLGVHVASVLGYFPYHSAPIEEALNRGHSIYLPRKYQNKENEYNKIIPIFPYSFSAQRASLIEEQPKLARSYYFEVANDGTVINQTFIKTIIVNNRNLTFDDVSKILKKGTDDPKLQETITNLEEVTEKISKHYRPLELYKRTKENNIDFSDLRVKNIGAEKIVYYPILLAGNKVAEYFAAPQREYPCLYRVHLVDEKTNRQIQSMINTLTETYGDNQNEKIYRLIKGVYPKGTYAPFGEHNGLALKNYCHCTSQLRRGPDIVIEHALEVCYDNNPTDKELYELEKEVKRRAIQINSKETPIECFVEDYAKIYTKKRIYKR